MANRYCSNCGKPIPEGSRFCIHCRAAVIQEPVTQDHGDRMKRANNTGYKGTTKPNTGMVCKKCGGTNIVTTPVAEMDKRGCLSTIMKIVLLFIPIIGWIAFFSLIRGRKTKTRLVSVCQDCGYKWYSGESGFGILTIIALIAGMVMLIPLLGYAILSTSGCSSTKDAREVIPVQAEQYEPNQYTYSTTSKPESMIAEEDRQVKDAIEAADAYIAREEYSKAYQVLSEANKSYPWRYELDNALTDCEKKYANNAIRLAAEVFAENQDYDAAIAELRYAQMDLPDNTAIINEIAKYEAYRPIKLSSLTSFYDENGEGLVFKQTQIMDNVGNTYSEWYRWDSRSVNSRERYTCYRINRNYSKITGTIFVDQENKNESFVGAISFYGDGKLLAGPFDMGKGSTPVIFDINVESIVELKIYIDSKGEDLWPSAIPHFANVMLYPKIDG